MTTAENLDRIVAHCRARLGQRGVGNPVERLAAEAGWRSTIAAIEWAREIELSSNSDMIVSILAAWPEELT